MPNYNNHLGQGYREISFKDKRVVSSINSESFRFKINALRNLPASIGTIPPGYEHRADRIADLFYGDPTLDWIVLWTNNISDPFEQLNIGDRIRILELP